MSRSVCLSTIRLFICLFVVYFSAFGQSVCFCSFDAPLLLLFICLFVCLPEKYLTGP